MNTLLQATVRGTGIQQYQVYEDGEGHQYVLTREQVGGQVWFALQLQPLSVVLLSQSNISRLHLIGRATLKA